MLLNEKNILIEKVAIKLSAENLTKDIVCVIIEIWRQNENR